MAAREVRSESMASTVEEPWRYNGSEGEGLLYVTSNGVKPVLACTKVLYDHSTKDKNLYQ